MSISAFFAGTVLEILNICGDAILKNTVQMLKFIKVQLLDTDIQVLSMGLSLLNQLFSNGIST